MDFQRISYRSPGNTVVIGVLQIIIAGFFDLCFLLGYFIMWLTEEKILYATTMQVLLFCIGVCTLILVRGIWNCWMQGRYSKLLRGMRSRQGTVTLEQLADYYREPVEKVLGDIRATLHRRYWQGIRVGENSLELVAGDKTIYAILPSRDMCFVRKAKRSYLGPAYMALAMWFLVGTATGFLYPLHYSVALVLCAITFFVAALLFPKQQGFAQKKVEPVLTFEQKPVDTGDERTDDAIKTGNTAIAELAQLSQRITGDPIESQVRELLTVSRQIFEEVEKNPEKSNQVRQFNTYYLPTTIKLLRNYDELSRQNVRGENIREALWKIENIMGDVLKTFHNQLDELYRDRSIDISAEIAVMENMINQNGGDIMDFVKKDSQ